MPEVKTGLQIKVRGIVQGVGFRPFIYTLALRHALTGWVKNTSAGVEIEVEGTDANLQSFLSAIRSQHPPLARIDSIESNKGGSNHHLTFEIIASESEPGQFIPISPDITICAECRQELFDPTNRRFRYPLINCTNCGPRFTIIQDLPYDRPKTTMASFIMCPNCQAEYENPLDRRFHAQPTACPVCGPQVSFIANHRVLALREDAIQIARSDLAKGKILAIKGLGGYLLACDALNSEAVDELRRRKKRSDKAFALMAFDLESIRLQCEIHPMEENLLISHSSPIVLLKRKNTAQISNAVAPNQSTLGFMLPYTPLHLLLMEPAAGIPTILVMTSGNMSEEPIAFTDDEALQKLGDLADGFLTHDRPIHMRMDDSVFRIAQGRPYPLRRSRGFAPDSIQLTKPVPSILATGAELKNTFCLTRDRYAFLSHHIGDLENLETLDSFETGIEHYERLFRIQPEAIACDLHPDYLASRYAKQRTIDHNLPLIQVQHHHAHLAACLADNGWESDEPVIGLCFDGTGLGTDNAIWGGEVLLGNYAGYQRFSHLAYAPLPGGDAATRKPARMALAHLWQAGLDWEVDLPPVLSLCAEERFALRTQLERHFNTPSTSSMGRFFDAASALLGIRQMVSYEGQASIELEALCDSDEQSSYPFDIKDDQFDPTPVWHGLLSDWRNGLPTSKISAKFHNSVIHLCWQLCENIRSTFHISTVALSGGVWQNMYLLEHCITLLQKKDFHVLWHRQVPANDGGLSLGQAMIASRQII